LTGKARKLPCPRCGTVTPYSPENKWRPFCSERCKMIDLGLWGSDAYRLPEKEEKGSEQVSSDSQDTDKQ
jgi:hypothetical protein